MGRDFSEVCSRDERDRASISQWPLITHASGRDARNLCSGIGSSRMAQVSVGWASGVLVFALSVICILGLNIFVAILHAFTFITGSQGFGPDPIRVAVPCYGDCRRVAFLGAWHIRDQKVPR